jgi:LDH2 family malate/lactate/ureidoglycolate dehydrogenase
MKIAPHRLHQFILALLEAAGIEAKEAAIIAQIFVWFDLIGRSTQGVSRLSAYLKRVELGLIKSPCRPEFIQKTETIYIVNGHDGFGHYLGHIAMLKAIDLAAEHGLGLVGVQHSNHFGAGAYYVQLAAQQLKLGLAFSNSVPHVAPHGGVTPALGTNPFAFGAPVRDGHSILVDLSTGASAGSVLKKTAEENQQIPEGIVIDREGRAITDPRAVEQGALLPFGGAKGFCLGLMIEILSGVLTGAAISHEIASLHKNFERASNIGHFFMAIDVAKIMPVEDYFERMDLLLGFVKAARKRDGVEEILIPGETRWRNYANQLANGIDLDSKAVEGLTDLARSMKVSSPW